jgi:hypothetical protein
VRGKIHTEEAGGGKTRIVITDETIRNLTGARWLDFHWIVMDHGDAWINVPLSADFDVQPFAQKTFSDPVQARELSADSGAVLPGPAFLDEQTPRGRPVLGSLLFGLHLLRGGSSSQGHE